jgi:acylphosphatase
MDNATARERLHLLVSGRVQGVGFRAFVAQAARNLGLDGWVRNVGYDQVETVAEGPRAVLEEFAKIVQTGPRISRVDHSQIDWLSASGEFSGFNIR